MISENITNEDILQLKASAYSISCPLLAVLCLIALLANGCVLAAVPFRQRSAMTPTLKITVSLLISDIWTSLLVLISVFYNSYLFFVLDIRITHACYSLALECLRTGGLVSGTLHLLALSFNHFLSITFPFKYRSILTRLVVGILIATLWTLPPGLILTFAGAKNGTGFQSENCTELAAFHHLNFRVAISTVLVLSFSIMAVFYLAVMLKLRKMRKSLSSGRGSSTQMRRERGMLITTLLILATFVVGWTPASVHYVLTCTQCLFRFDTLSLGKLRLVIIISVVQMAIIMIKSMLNPIIYAVRIPEIKERIKTFSDCIKRSSLLSSQTSSQSGRAYIPVNGANREYNHMQSQKLIEANESNWKRPSPRFGSHHGESPILSNREICSGRPRILVRQSSTGSLNRGIQNFGSDLNISNIPWEKETHV